MVINKVSSALRNNITRDDTSKNLMTFCIQLFHHAQFKITRKFFCGSSVEISEIESVAEQHGVDVDMLDMDYVIYNIYNYATYPSKTFSKFYNPHL